MKYIAGGLGSDFRGKLGSIVGSRNYSDNFLRKLNVPRDPKTALQLSKRSNFYKIAKAWQLVTAPNLILWKQFSRCNTIHQFAGADLLPDRISDV